MATEVQPQIDPDPPAPTAVVAVEPAVKAAAVKGKEKDAKGKQKKGQKSDADDGAGAQGPSVAAHPRAARAVARSKGWGGLGGFLLGGYLSLPTSTFAGTALRALEAGVVCYLVAWAAAVFIWRRLVILELKGREQKLVTHAQSQLPAASVPSAEQSRARVS